MCSVATFNVNCICETPTRELVASMIANCGIDVVCLQETNEKWEEYLSSDPTLKTIYPYMKFYNISRNRWAGFACLSVHQIESFEAIPEIDRGWYPAGRVIIQCDSSSSIKNNTNNSSSTANHNMSNMRKIQLLIVHLRAPVVFSAEPYWWGGHVNWVSGFFSEAVKARRLEEIQTFTRSVSSSIKNMTNTTGTPKIPTIILGDFNERRNGGRCLQYLKDSGYEYARKHDDTPSYLCCCHKTNTWSFQVGGITLLSFDYDHLFYSKKHLELVDGVARVHKDNGGSDHRLVSAIFQFTGTK